MGKTLDLPDAGCSLAEDAGPTMQAARALAATQRGAGAGIVATGSEAAPANGAAFAFRTGSSARARTSLLGDDEFSLKIGPDTPAFDDAIRIERAGGQVDLPQPTVLPGLSAAPTPPPAGHASADMRRRPGAPWIDVRPPSGRDFPLQPRFWVNRFATWSPSATKSLTAGGMPVTSFAAVSHLRLAATNLAASMWR